MPYWAVAQTETQREHLARTFLMRQEFETYMPRIKRRGIVQPLFPTYLFFRYQDRWYDVRWSIGITRVLMDGERPARLSDEIVASIQRREIGGIVVLPRAPRLRMGQPVRVLRGSFESLVGVYDGMVGRDRERILLDLLGRKVPVILSGRDVASMK
jgi:transcription antitermination factor NusG